MYVIYAMTRVATRESKRSRRSDSPSALYHLYPQGFILQSSSFDFLEVNHIANSHIKTSCDTLHHLQCGTRPARLKLYEVATADANHESKLSFRKTLRSS